MYGRYNANDGQLAGLFSKKKDANEKRRDFLFDELQRKGLRYEQSYFLRRADVDRNITQQWQEFYLQMINKYGQDFLNDANNVTPPGFIGYDWEQRYAEKQSANAAELERLRLLAVQSGMSAEQALRNYPIPNQVNIGQSGQIIGATQGEQPQMAGISGWMYAVPLALAGAVVGIKQLSKKRK